MIEEERRRAPRRAGTFPVLVRTEDVQLEGQTVNLSRSGILVHARGQVRVTLELNGNPYSARLVRVNRVDDDTVECALALDNLIDDLAKVAGE